jgi:DNA-directed RNA polymerase subunit RPC12/RpoP
MIAHFISLNCAKCGGSLEVYDDMERFACGYCGAELLVERRGGTVALQVGTSKASPDLDLLRLKEDARALLTRRELILKRMDQQRWGYVIGVVLLLVGIFVVRSGKFATGLSAMMAGILTISFTRRNGKVMLASIRELDVKIDMLNGRIEDRGKLANV